MFCFLSCSQRVHSHQEEVQVPVLQLFCHAPVHPEETHEVPHRGEALPLRDLREEVHPPRAHEAPHLGKGRAGASALLCRVKRTGASPHFSLDFVCSSEGFPCIFLPCLSKALWLAACSSSFCSPSSARGFPGFCLDISKMFFTERVAQPWHRLPRTIVESPSLEGFNKDVNVAFGDMI